MEYYGYLADCIQSFSLSLEREIELRPVNAFSEP